MPANLSALTPSSTYTFWIRSNCGSGDQSYWTPVPGTFVTLAAPATVYCIPNQTSAPDGIGLTNVTMGTINNTTGLEPGGYGNFSNLITNVAQGATVPVTLTFQTGGMPKFNTNGLFELSKQTTKLPSLQSLVFSRELEDESMCYRFMRN